MPGLRALASSLAAGGIVFVVVGFWMRWPLFLAVAAGALFLVAALMTIGSFADDGSAADAAWTEASADLPRGRPFEREVANEHPDAEAGTSVVDGSAGVRDDGADSPAPGAGA
ncbi:MAG TPA: hypothetical protein VF763_04555 [Candidatus Limnocylindrales bacterium]